MNRTGAAAPNDTGVAAHPVDIHLGVRLRELRSYAKFSQAALAERVGLSPAMIHWYEVGESRISASTLFDLAAGLGCTVGDFYYGLDPSVAECDEPSRTPLSALLKTRAGAALVEAYSRVPQSIQDEIAALAQVLADP